MRGRRVRDGTFIPADKTWLNKFKVLLGCILSLDVLFNCILFFLFDCSSYFSFLDCTGYELVLCLVRIPLLVGSMVFGSSFGKPVEGEQQDDADVDDDSVNLIRKEPEEDRERLTKERKAMAWKYGAIGMIFCVTTASQVVYGIKATLAPLDPQTVNRAGVQWVIVLLIIVLNAELFFCKKIVDALTTEEGLFIRTSHHHRLFLKRDLGWARCDRCHKRIQESRCYSCSQCDWDVCLGCIKKDKKKEEKRKEADILPDEKEEEELTLKEYFRHGFDLLRPNLVLVIFALLFLLAKQVATVMLPNYTGQILDAVIKGTDEIFKQKLTAFIVINVLLGLCTGASRLLFSAVSQKMEVNLRTSLFERILSQEIEFFDNMTTGELLAKLHEDTRTMLSPVQFYLSSVLGAVLSLFGGLIMCVNTSWRLSILAFTILGPLSLITTTYAKWAAKLWNKVWGHYSSMNDTARESFENVRTIRAFGREDRMVEEYNQSAKSKLKMAMKEAYYGGLSATVTSLMELALQALVLTYGGISILQGGGASDGFTVGNLITFQLYWNMLQGAFRSITDQLNQFTRASGAAQRVIRLLEKLPSVDPNEGLELEDGIGDIEFRNVSFRYKSRPENLVLKDLSMKIKRGSVVALVGRSGGGKSTIVSLLCGNYKPEKGEITIDGVGLSELKAKEYRKRLGIVQQETEIFNESLERNIVFGVEHYTREELLEAAEKANCLEFITKFDEGFATKVGERGVKISGGQKQRIALARVMIKKPQLLILDEATSSLDSESEAHVQAAIDTLMSSYEKSKPTVLLVAHRLSTVINADLICVIEKGEVVEQGTHHELLQRRGIYAKLVEKQVSKMANTLNQNNDERSTTMTVSVDDLYDEVLGKADTSKSSESKKEKGKGEKYN